MRQPLLVLLPPLLLSLASCSCSGNGGDTIDASRLDAPIPPSCIEAAEHVDFAWIRDNIFNRSCANFSTCHDRSQPAGMLDLTPLNAYDEIVNVPSHYFSDWMLVKPFSPDESYLLVRLRCKSDTVTTGEMCAPGPVDGGSLMPPNSNPLCIQKTDLVRRWIELGALEFPPADAGPPPVDAGPVDATTPPVDAAPPDAP